MGPCPGAHGAVIHDKVAGHRVDLLPGQGGVKQEV